jgi:hypothetical protein
MRYGVYTMKDKFTVTADKYFSVDGAFVFKRDDKIVASFSMHTTISVIDETPQTTYDDETAALNKKLQWQMARLGR